METTDEKTACWEMFPDEKIVEDFLRKTCTVPARRAKDYRWLARNILTAETPQKVRAALVRLLRREMLP